jgi:hypothetical protein
MSNLTKVLNKLKRLPQTSISQLMVTFALIYIASTMANITWLVLPGGVNGAAGNNTVPGVFAYSRQAKPAGQSFNISTLTAMNIFGQFVTKPTQNVLQPEIQRGVAPPTTLDLTLTATVTED